MLRFATRRREDRSREGADRSEGIPRRVPALRGIVADLINLAESQQEIIVQLQAIIAMNRRRGELNEQPVG